jgi:hypothetical protein
MMMHGLTNPKYSLQLGTLHFSACKFSDFHVVCILVLGLLEFYADYFNVFFRRFGGTSYLHLQGPCIRSKWVPR